MTNVHYEINVSQNGVHLFATHKRSLQTEEDARRVYSLFLNKFPKVNGYLVTCTRWDCIGTSMNWNG